VASGFVLPSPPGGHDIRALFGANIAVCHPEAQAAQSDGRYAMLRRSPAAEGGPDRAPQRSLLHTA
jgi:hypothetical protein